MAEHNHIAREKVMLCKVSNGYYLLCAAVFGNKYVFNSLQFNSIQQLFIYQYCYVFHDCNIHISISEHDRVLRTTVIPMQLMSHLL